MYILTLKLEQNIRKYDRLRKKIQLEVTMDVLCVFSWELIYIVSKTHGFMYFVYNYM